MNKPDDVTPAEKPAPHRLPDKAAVLDLDIVADAQTKTVANAVTQSRQALESFQKSLQSPILAETLKNFGSIGKNFENLMPRTNYPGIELKHIVIPPNPQHQTNRLLADLLRETRALNQQNAKLVAPNYDYVNDEIIFANKRIPVPKDSDQSELCRFLFSHKDEPAKEWSWDEVYDWDSVLDQTTEKKPPKDGWRKVYNAGREINKRVAIETGVKDLLNVTVKTTGFNSKYFGQTS